METKYVFHLSDPDIERLIESLTGRIAYFKSFASGDKFSSAEVSALEKLRNNLASLRGKS